MKKLTTRDMELIKQLSKTAVITPQQIKNYTTYKDSRIKDLCKAGYLKKEKAIVKGKTNIVYRLGENGRDYAYRNFKSMYKFASSKHDTALTDAYYYYASLGADMDTWRSETDLQKEYGKAVDAVLEHNGVTIAVEVITSNYSQQEIQQKIDFAVSNNMQQHFIKV